MTKSVGNFWKYFSLQIASRKETSMYNHTSIKDVTKITSFWPISQNTTTLLCTYIARFSSNRASSKANEKYNNNHNYLLGIHWLTFLQTKFPAEHSSYFTGNLWKEPFLWKWGFGETGVILELSSFFHGITFFASNTKDGVP